MEKGFQFLPVSRDEMIERGWYYYDFLVVSADGYIDHPSFGSTLIARLLESEGYRVAMLAQPKWDSAADFLAMQFEQMRAASMTIDRDVTVCQCEYRKEDNSHEHSS